MVYGGLDAAATFDLYQWHKSFGFVGAGVDGGAARRAPCRLFASASGFPALGATLAASAQGLALRLDDLRDRTGWLVVSASPLPIPTRFFDLFVIPNIAPPDPSLFAAAVLAHKLAAWAIAFLVALHVAGALKHHFIEPRRCSHSNVAALAEARLRRR